MFQTWDNSQLLRRVLWISAELTIVSSLKQKNTQHLYVFNRVQVLHQEWLKEGTWLHSFGIFNIFKDYQQKKVILFQMKFIEIEKNAVLFAVKNIFWSIRRSILPIIHSSLFKNPKHCNWIRLGVLWMNKTKFLSAQKAAQCFRVCLRIKGA